MRQAISSFWPSVELHSRRKTTAQPPTSAAPSAPTSAALATVPAGAEEWWRHPTWYDPAVFEAVQCLEQILWCVYQPVRFP